MKNNNIYFLSQKLNDLLKAVKLHYDNTGEILLDINKLNKINEINETLKKYNEE